MKKLRWIARGLLAVELGSLVNFTRVNRDVLLWDSQFVAGFRCRLGNAFSIGVGDPYGRLYAGWGPAVLVYRDPSADADRVHIEGPIAGLALGRAYETDRRTPYFVELGLSVHELRDADRVRDDGVIPTTLSRTSVGKARIYSLQLSLGGLAF